jgi:outer membrane biogenesis lipoprotein LolB
LLFLLLILILLLLMGCAAPAPKKVANNDLFVLKARQWLQISESIELNFRIKPEDKSFKCGITIRF